MIKWHLFNGIAIGGPAAVMMFFDRTVRIIKLDVQQTVTSAAGACRYVTLIAALSLLSGRVVTVAGGGGAAVVVSVTGIAVDAAEVKRCTLGDSG